MKVATYPQNVFPYRGRPPVLGWSLHMTGGWHSHFARLERWHSRLLATADENDHLDYLFAFFENSYALRDWLLDAGVSSQREIDALFAQHAQLRINRDLAN